MQGKKTGISPGRSWHLFRLLIFFSFFVSSFQVCQLRELAASALFRAIAQLYAGRPGVFKQQRRLPLANCKHFIRQLSDLPLRTFAAAKREKVPKLPGIHGHDKACLRSLRQNITRVLSTFSRLNQSVVFVIRTFCGFRVVCIW